MNLNSNLLKIIYTPAFVFDERKFLTCTSQLERLNPKNKTKFLYSTKACATVEILKSFSGEVSGFSCSSVFEANLVTHQSEPRKQIQIVTPGLTKEFLAALHLQPDLLTFNSIEQFDRLVDSTSPETRLAIRVNPRTQFVKNDKFNPCRPCSKLGVVVEKIIQQFENNDEFRERITGIHVHNNCESDNFKQLRDTVEKLKPLLDPKFGIDWINLGGGYEIVDMDPQPFIEVVDDLTDDFGLEVFFEPGGGLVREAGYLVSTIVDIFESDGESIVILDTTVNHAPEVFEYGWSPPVLGAIKDGKYRYTLAGCSCLAGDIFGKYGFDKPLSVGEKVVFGSLGAYAMPKWSYFNGINLPSIYILTCDGELVLKKSFTFEDFANRCGVSKIVTD